MNQKYSTKHNLQSNLRRLYYTDFPCKKITKLVGIHRVGFILHIEKYFLEGMSYNNCGTEWSFDHIVPLHLFDLNNEEDLKLAYNFNNIMPMFNDDNRLKGGSIHFSIMKLQSMPKNEIIEKLLSKCYAEHAKIYQKYLI